MTRLYYDDSKYIVWLDGRSDISPPIAICDKCSVSIMIMSRTDCRLLPQAGVIRVDSDGKIISDIVCLPLGEDSYYLYPTQVRIMATDTLSILSQTELSGHLVTVYNDGETKAIIENSTHYFEKVLSKPPIKTESFETAEGRLFIIMESSNLCIVLYDGHDYISILDLPYDSCDFDENGITLYRAMNDNQGRCVTAQYTYSHGAYECADRKIKYSNAHRCPVELLPLDLWDAVTAQDIEYTKTLLSDDLDIDAVLGFIGADSSPILPILTEDCSRLLFDCNGEIKCFSFVIKDRIICDIIEK